MGTETTKPRTFYIVQAADRIRGTWSNPVVDRGLARRESHGPRISPPVLIRELLQRDRDWALYDLRDNIGNVWTLGTERDRANVARMIATATDLLHGWVDPGNHDNWSGPMTYPSYVDAWQEMVSLATA